MIDFVRYVCLKHIAVGPRSLPDRFEDVSNPLLLGTVTKSKSFGDMKK